MSSYFLIYSGILSGMIASQSVTLKFIENPSSENKNFLISILLTMGFYSTIGILICLFIGFFLNYNFERVGLIFLLSALTYYILGKQIIKLKLPTFIEILLYGWSFLLYYASVTGILSRLGIFEKDLELYSFFISIGTLIGLMITPFNFEKNYFFQKSNNSNSNVNLMKKVNEELDKKGYKNKDEREAALNLGLLSLKKKMEKFKKMDPKDVRKQVLDEIEEYKKKNK
jgi:hypothetical protein